MGPFSCASSHILIFGLSVDTVPLHTGLLISVELLYGHGQ